MMIDCPQCSAVMRRVPGLHQAGEPYMQSDEHGSFMTCLMCGTRVAWRDDEDDSGLDFGSDPVMA
jgi:hypothetical protein